MKLHSWIVIGMTAGLAIGWLLGPDSPVASGDVVVLPAGQAPAIHEAPDGARLPAPDREIQALVVRRADGWAALSLREGVAVQDGRWVVLRSDEETARRTVYVREQRLPPQRYTVFGLSVLSFLSLLGDLFLRLLKMLVVPLVIASLSAGVASLGDPRKLGKMGLVTIGYFLATTAVAVTIGLAVALALEPGSTLSDADRARLIVREGATIDAAELPGLADQIRSIVPANPILALAEGDMLGIIFFAVMLGAALCLMPAERSRPLLRLLESGSDVMVRMVHMVMATAPIGVGAMMAVVTARSGLAVLLSLAAYGGVVLLGLALHVAFCYVPVVRLLAGVGVLRFFAAARPTQILTFGTSSSSAALPVTMECAQTGLGISKHVTTFVIPVGSTVNMDGTALYQGVATVYIAQLYGLELGPLELLQVVAMATLASIGAAGVPGAGMVTLTIVLIALGLPVEGIAIIMSIDRILDMFRSVVNVTGDIVCAAVVARVEGERPGTSSLHEPEVTRDDVVAGNAARTGERGEDT